LPKYLCTFVFLFSFLQFLEGQKSIEVNFTDQELSIDGVLDEEIWSKSKASGQFWQYTPKDTVQAEAQTEIKMCFDDNNLYIAVKCYAIANDWIVSSLKRDYRAGGTDNITLVVNPFNDGTNAFFFGINPKGVIREGTIANGGSSFGDFSESWENKWSGESKIFDGYYTAELAIPFSTLRYNAESSKWSFGAYRFETQSNEISTWTNTPNNQTMFSLAYMGDMLWEKKPPSPGKNVSLIPYVSGAFSRDYEAGTPTDYSYDFGGDAKIGITSGLNLDVTINPNFSQVEVDRQITNLDRFEIFFPERRQFFLENADLFGSFGFSDINPFFSRRIGAGEDLNSGDVVQNQILGGLRLSGKLNDKLRLGLLNMQTGADQGLGILGSNFSVAAIQQQVLSRSNLSFVLVNKNVFGDLENFLIERENPSTIGGVDFNFANADNTISGKTFLHYNLRGGEIGTSLAHGLGIDYSRRVIGLGWRHEYVGSGYNAPVGFIRRTNYYKFTPSVRVRFYPEDGYFINHSINVNGNVFFKPNVGRTDHRYNLNWGGQLQNSARLNTTLTHEYILLTDAFDPTGTDSPELESGTDYNFLSFSLNYRSDGRKKFFYSIRPTIGQYYNGFRAGLGGNIGLRNPPKASISINYNWNYFDMPHLPETKQTFLIGPRIDYTFSKELFWTTFIQYNTQSQQTNINSRIQWRFAPASDFFLVWTDNYSTGNLDGAPDRFAFDIENRSIIAKLTYWFNL